MELKDIKVGDTIKLNIEVEFWDDRDALIERLDYGTPYKVLAITESIDSDYFKQYNVIGLDIEVAQTYLGGEKTYIEIGPDDLLD